MGDLDRFKNSTQAVRITGGNEQYDVDVILEDGIRKIATTKKVNIESLSASVPNATNYIEFEETAVGDTLTVTIQASDTTPLYSVTKTVQVGEDRFTFTDRIILELNQDFVNFQPYFKVSKVKNNSILFFESKTVGEAGENLAIDAFTATATGTLDLTLIRAFDNWERRSAVIQASKSSTDPRLGIFGIAGTVESKDASVEGLFVQQPYDTTPGVIDLNVNGSGTPVVFTFPMDSLDDLFISEIKFFGRDNGMQFSNFLGINGALTNGIIVEIKTDNSLITLPPIRTTDDFDDVFSFGGSNFDIYFASGADKFTARFLASAFPLRRAGTFGAGNDDYIKITIQDNLTSVNYLRAIVEGFRQEA